MKAIVLGLCMLMAGTQAGAATTQEQELLSLSKDKWRWMAERNLDALGKLFADEAVFVHMSRTLTKSQELEVIRSGDIQYKEAQIEEASVRFVGATAIVLNKIKLVAVVRGADAVNPFTVTEVYVKVDSAWKLTSLSFTRLVTPPPPEGPAPSAQEPAKVEQEILTLSRDKWRWMAERNVEALGALFHDKAVFVHMGGTMSKAQELDVIKSGMIQYKQADIQEASVQLIGTTAVLLNKIRLTAVVGGNEVVNPFVVTEVYVQEGGSRKLASVSFTRLMTP